jgi:hypothetical protein
MLKNIKKMHLFVDEIKAQYFHNYAIGKLKFFVFLGTLSLK